MYVMGLDIGYSNLKIVYGYDNQPEQVSEVLPVGVMPADGSTKIVSSKNGEEVLVNGKLYRAGIDPGCLAKWKRSLHAEYTSTDEYFALFMLALKKCNRQQIDFLVTGLPMKLYLEEKNQKELVSRLKGTHEVIPGNYVTVRDVMVIPQPVGSYFDVSYSLNKESDFKMAEMLVFDPGFFSVDWLYFSNLEVQPEMCGTSTDATSMILKRVDQLLYDEFNHRISSSKLESLLQAGETEARIGKRRVPLADYINKASEEVSSRVLTDILGCIRSSERTIDIVILTGGGAEMYRSSVEKTFPDVEIIVPERSVEANARGFWYCGASE